MVSKYVRFELIATPLGLLACFIVISIFAFLHVYNGLQVIILPLWIGTLVGTIILVLIDQRWTINSLERINRFLKPLFLGLIVFYAVISTVSLLKLVTLDAISYIFILSLFTGTVSGFLITACLKVYLLVLKENDGKIALNPEMDDDQRMAS
ncbi:MAG: hypothetical protein ACFFD4_12810 [Candidatus Odinarchaeota archaeon]